MASTIFLTLRILFVEPTDMLLDQDEGRAAAGGGHLSVHLSLELPGLAVGDEPRAQIEVEALHPRSLPAARRRHPPAPVP